MLDDEEFLKDLMETFRQEAEEHIRVLSGAIVDLENAGDLETARGPIETLYRQLHSLKGAAAAVGLPLIVSVCQESESVLAALKRGDLALSLSVVDLLSESVDCLNGCLLTKELGADRQAPELLRELTNLSNTRTAEPAPETSTMVFPGPSNGSPDRSSAPQAPAAQAQTGLTPETAAPDSPAPSAPAPETPTSKEPEAKAAPAAETPIAATDTVRVSTSKLESLMLQAEEFISVKLATGQRSKALRDVSTRLDEWKREWYQARISGEEEKMEEFLEWNSAFMEGLAADIRMLAKSTDDERRTMGPMVDELLDGMKRVLMLPVSSLLSSFPKMVRDLARSRGKVVDFSITGADIEIDKRIIENLKDPLTHILRNAVDHGVEAPEVRQGLGKPVRGQIVIAVSQLENNKIQIRVSDDGGGIDVDRLREVAVREGLRTQGQVEATDDAEALRLAFASGLSTSQVVSQISGRGLGLAIVEEKVENLGGSVTVETGRGKGTTFRIIVPATLATARGILAQVSDWPFVMPVVGVDRVVRVRKGHVRLVENRETIQLEGRTVPLVYMQEVLDLPVKPQRNASDYIQAVVAGSGDDRVAFAVDRILGEQEVLVKTLGPQLVRVRNISGGTIIGSGKVVPIINTADLLQSASRRSAMEGRIEMAGSNGNGARKAVLVVEDSITSRMLLKNVLEAAGYYVKPTVDGLDALSALHEEDFDLVISDIEMPRMDGFELTSKIRNDTRLARVPVLLVTAMESQEQKERGIDVGANAYLTKSSFTQGTLLETARSLL
ncbi:MAG: response regulator [Thermoleophilia bacterium]|nr:response regulator [Thermoleophilia bacterium]